MSKLGYIQRQKHCHTWLWFRDLSKKKKKCSFSTFWEEWMASEKIDVLGILASLSLLPALCLLGIGITSVGSEFTCVGVYCYRSMWSPSLLLNLFSMNEEFCVLREHLKNKFFSWWVCQMLRVVMASLCLLPKASLVRSRSSTEVPL